MSEPSTEPRRSISQAPPEPRAFSHDLIAIAEWIPGKPPTPYDPDVFDAIEYETRFWRCRTCGQERNRRSEFTDACPVERLPSPMEAGGYSIEDPRTRRALSEEMTVQYGEVGPVYVVDSESGATYRVDIEAETCTCPDHEKREVFCKHLRRVDLEIRAGVLPGPDGTYVR